MKISLFIFTLLILSGCVSHVTSVSKVSKTAQPTPTVENANSNANNQFSYTDYQYDSALLDKLNTENERFRAVPDEFKSVDFENFKYEFGRLKNGEFEKEYSKKYAQGGVRYNFQDAFYVDLIGDEKKEAIVFLSSVSCGVSCDGGRYIVYFYSSQKGKPTLVDFFETGANAGGCSLKSFTVKERKIYVEQFGKCITDSKIDENEGFFCKFCVKDETHKTYTLSEKVLKQGSLKIVETEQINVMNSPTIISINE